LKVERAGRIAVRFVRAYSQPKTIDLQPAVKCQAAMLGWNNSETPKVFCRKHRETTKGGSLSGKVEGEWLKVESNAFGN
jgi:hypothetical protein